MELIYTTEMSASDSFFSTNWKYLSWTESSSDRERFVVYRSLIYRIHTLWGGWDTHTTHARKQACVYHMNLVQDGINEHSVVQRFRQVSEPHSASDFSIVSTRRLLIIHGVDFWCDSAKKRYVQLLSHCRQLLSQFGKEFLLHAISRTYCTSALAQSAVIVWGGYDIYIYIVNTIFWKWH